MRRLQAIALALALLAAPMALFAGVWECACAAEGGGMACCPHGKCAMMQQQGQCRGSTMGQASDCRHWPSPVTLAPLTQMMLPHAVPMPRIERGAPGLPWAAVAIASGLLPSTFHPPRD